MSETPKPKRPDIAKTIVSMVTERGADKTVCPSEIARFIAGSDEKDWRRLMTPIRKAAVKLADAGRIELRRKGETVDPHDFKGIYRIGLPVKD